jgi:flagellar hook-basal body complex protein FliE
LLVIINNGFAVSVATMDIRLFFLIKTKGVEKMRITPDFSVSKPLISQSKNETQNLSGVGFGELLRKSVQQVNDLQLNAENLDKQLAMGTLENVHDATIAAEKAALAVELTAQIRNKVLEAYQEIMRITL